MQHVMQNANQKNLESKNFVRFIESTFLKNNNPHNAYLKSSQIYTCFIKSLQNVSHFETSVISDTTRKPLGTVHAKIDNIQPRAL